MLLYILIIIAAIAVIAWIAANSSTPKALLRKVEETLDQMKQAEKARKFIVKLQEAREALGQTLKSLAYELKLYKNLKVIAVVVVILVIAGLVFDGADVPLQTSFFRATLNTPSEQTVWLLAIGTIVFITVVVFAALVVPALWTTMIATWKRRAVIVSVVSGAVVMVTFSILSAVKFVDVATYAYMKGITFWSQVLLTEFLPITAGALHATAFLYGRPRSVEKKKAAIERAIKEIDEVITKLTAFTTNPEGDDHDTHAETVTVPAEFLVADADADGVR